MNNKYSKVGNEDSALVAKKLSISEHSHLVTIRKLGRNMAAAANFNQNSQTLIVTALSEIARNILEYANEGEITLQVKKWKGKKCFFIAAVDTGPGIEDVEEVLQEGFTTGKGMGMGLPGAKRVMDEFEIESEIGVGTTIKMCKWLKD